MKVTDAAGQNVPLDIEVAAKAKRTRKVSRPTTPELKALYFQVAINLTQREHALFMYAMGRSGDGGRAFLDLVLHPTGDPA
jgi:hypothetical protein